MNPLTLHNPGWLAGLGRLDTDTAAYVAARGLTDANYIAQLDTLVRGLKAAGTWAKCHVIYEMAGPTSDASKWNMRDPRDLDAAYRLTFFGSPVHAATGVQWNGTTQYATTYFTFAGIPATSRHLCVYSRNNSTVSGGEMGRTSIQNGTFDGLFLYSGGNAFYYLSDLNGHSAAAGPTTGLFVATRVGTSAKLFRNGTQLRSATSTPVAAVSTAPLELGRANGQYSNRHAAFYTAGEGLTDDEVQAHTAVITAFLTARGRTV